MCTIAHFPGPGQRISNSTLNVLTYKKSSYQNI